MTFSPNDWREARRFRAFRLSREDWRQTDIAEALGVSRSAVGTWLKEAREQGSQALRTSPRPGRPAELSGKERARLPSLLDKGLEHFGFRGEVWTRGRVGAVIEEESDVSHSGSHVGRILRDIGWSLQKPAERG
jgi:transposase